MQQAYDKETYDLIDSALDLVERGFHPGAMRKMLEDERSKGTTSFQLISVMEKWKMESLSN